MYPHSLAAATLANHSSGQSPERLAQRCHRRHRRRPRRTFETRVTKSCRGPESATLPLTDSPPTRTTIWTESRSGARTPRRERQLKSIFSYAWAATRRTANGSRNSMPIVGTIYGPKGSNVAAREQSDEDVSKCRVEPATALRAMRSLALRPNSNPARGPVASAGACQPHGDPAAA